MRLSLKERRMKSANAIKTYRKSGVAEGRDLRFYGPFVGMFFDGAKRFADPSQTEGFIARSRRACPERSRRNPGDACWQILLGAFRPQPTAEDKKVTNSERSRPVPACRGGICGSADRSWKCFSGSAVPPRPSSGTQLLITPKSSSAQ